MTRWLLLFLGLAIGAAGLVALVRDGDPPLDEIDAASRARLERVLQQADREAAGR